MGNRSRWFLWAIPGALLLVLVVVLISWMIQRYRDDQVVERENQRQAKIVKEQVEFEQMLDKLFPHRTGQPIDWDAIAEELNRPNAKRMKDEESKKYWDDFTRRWHEHFKQKDQ